MLCVAIGALFIHENSSAHAATLEPAETTGLTFLLNENEQSYKVRILDKTLKSVTIPSTYNGLPVTAIDDSGFTGCTALEKIIIPSSINYVGNNAFMRCTNLKKVLGMSGVTSLGSNAFAMCSKLEYLILPHGLTNVGTSMLSNVKATVYSRTLEDDLLQLNSACLTAFSGNIIYGNDLVYEKYVDPQTDEKGVSLVSWQNIDLYPDGFEDGTTLIVESWHSDVRDDVSDSDKIEGKVLNIAMWAFADCNAENIIIRNSAGYNHSINIESYAFAQCSAINVSLEADITLDDPYDGTSVAVFYDSSNLQSVTLPDTIDTISYQMFMDCRKLQTIKFLDDAIDNNVLSSKIRRIEGSAFYYCYSIPELTISENIEYVGQYAFYAWGSSDIYQNIYINLEQPGEWNSQWDSNINYNNCNVEFIAVLELNVQFVVEQEGVINAVGSTIKTVTRNSKLSELDLETPYSDSHEFSGIWYTSSSRSAGTEFASDKPIKSDMILYAGWKIKTFNVTFPLVNSCSFYDLYNDECLDSQLKRFEYGESYTFYLKTNDGYRDIQCFKNGDPMRSISGDVYTLEITDNLNITVTYRLIEYCISYTNLRQGINPNAHITKYNVESDTIRFQNPIWEAYENAHWNISYIPKGSTGNKEIRAVWENPKEFTITLKLDEDPNASNPNGSVKKYTVENIVRLADPTSLGYISGSWVNSEGTVISGWDPDEYWQDMTLIVKWGEGRRYIVRFDLNGGSGDNTSVEVTYGDTLPAKAKPTRTDYYFLGYYSVNNGKQYYDFDMVRQKWYQTDNDTLVADWEQVNFLVTFTQENGMGLPNPQSFKIKYDGEWPTITMPIRKGFYTDGFYYKDGDKKYKIYNADGTFNSKNEISPMSFSFDHDITLTCTWEVEYYYSFIIDQINVRASSGTLIKDGIKLTYEDSYAYTLQEATNTWIEYAPSGDVVSRDTRAFTKWIIRLNGPDGGDLTSNPWIDFSDNMTLSFKVQDQIAKLYPNYNPQDIIYIRALYQTKVDTGTCVAGGTLITLADGTQVPVEQLKGDESLLVWNLYTGKFDITPILFIDQDPAMVYEIVNLYFSDGTSVKVIGEHGFWDFTLNKYVYLDNNASQYMGHLFNKQIFDDKGQMVWTKVQLTNVVITNELTTSWSPVTYGHLCYFVNGMLSMPGGIEGLFNIFEVDSETMKYDESAMQADIEQYGLFTYEEFYEIIPVPIEMFEAVNGQYLKVAISKGLINWETLERLIERYVIYFENL